MVHVPYPSDKLARVAAEYAACNNEQLQRRDVARMMGGPEGPLTGASVAQWFPKTASSYDIPDYRLGLLTEALKQKGVNIEFEWWLLPLDEFDARRDGGPADHPGRLLKPWINDTPFVGFETKPRGLVNVAGLMGAATPVGAYRQKPFYQIGTTTKLEAVMPFHGRLTVIGADLVDKKWHYWCLDRLLGIESRDMSERWVLPEHRGAVPFNPPEGECALIAIATASAAGRLLVLPWQGRTSVENVVQVEPKELRQIADQLGKYRDTQRAVSLFEYSCRQ
jgi:hypothetical protein